MLVAKNNYAARKGKRTLSAFAVLALAACGDDGVPTACQDNLQDVTQLIVVTTETMDGAAAKITTFRRTSESERGHWKRVKAPFDAVIGSAGLGWGHSFETFKRYGEVLKREGDKRTPAGVFPVGTTFGFGPAPWSGHLNLSTDPQVCVDDLGSPHYGSIVSRQTAGAETSAEDMASIGVYRRGIVVNYPTAREKKSGSCIFFHIWEDAKTGTAGCIAAQETRIAALQDFRNMAKTAVVIWPRSAGKRLRRCLPGLPDKVFSAARGKS